MLAREREAALLARCTVAALPGQLPAADAREANVFRVAAILVRTHFPQQANRLRHSSECYFLQHPDARLAAEQVVGQGWVPALPRFRDLLCQSLRAAR